MIGKQADQRAGEQQADQRACCHDQPVDAKGIAVNAVDARGFSCAVVIADDRPHPLHRAACRQIQKGLQLVVAAEDDDIERGIRREQCIEEGNQQRRQGKAECGRQSDRVQPQIALRVGPQPCAPDADGKRAAARQQQVNCQRDTLPQSGGDCRACNAERGKGAEAENQQRVEQDVGNTAAQQAEHGALHPANRLEDLFKGHAEHDDDRKGKGDGGVLRAIRNHLPILREHTQEGGHQGDAANGGGHAVYGRQQQPFAGGVFRSGAVTGTQ